MGTSNSRLYSYLLLFSATLIFFASCSGGGNSNSKPLAECDSMQETSTSALSPKSENVGTAVASENPPPNEMIEDASGDRVYFAIPAPDETLSYITEGGLTFNPDLMNPIENQSKYVDSRLKSINLGGYFADVAYTAMFSQPGRSAEYMKAIEEFGVEISVFSNADKKIRERMSSNFNNVDSVAVISKEAYEVIVDYLFTSNRQKTYALLCIGSYVESMYLVLNYADKFRDFSPKMVKKIIEQKLLFDDIYRIMLTKKGDPDIDLTLTEIAPIKASFDKMGFIVSNPTSGENKQGDMVIKSDSRYEYSEGSFTAFRNDLFALRNRWTGN